MGTKKKKALQRGEHAGELGKGLGIPSVYHFQADMSDLLRPIGAR